MTADYHEIFRTAGARWLEGDPSAIEGFERGIEAALEAGDLPAAVAAHQKLRIWKPQDAALHERIARAIAAARDRSELRADSTPRLSSVPLFSGISREELTTLLTMIKSLRVACDQAVVREGEPGDSLYLVVEGMLRVTTRGDSGEEIRLADLGPGDFFGEVSLLTGRPRTATVTAASDAELLELDRDTVDRLRHRHAQIEDSLSEFHRRRAEHTIEALIERMKQKRAGA
jgi:hypothetical protein